MVERLIQYVRSHYGLMIGELTSKRAIRACKQGSVALIRGRDALSGFPAKITLSALEVRHAITERK